MLKKVWADPVWSKVIATAICGIAITAFGWWDSIWNGLSIAWAYLMASALVPRWLFVLLVIFALLGLFSAYIFMALRRDAVAAAKEGDVDWSAYRTDEFLGLRWRWKLNGGALYDVTVFCPSCDFQLDPLSDTLYQTLEGTKFRCDCGCGPWSFKGSWPALEHQIKKMVQQKLRNGTWKKNKVQPVE